jgi:hypothetical protein
MRRMTLSPRFVAIRRPTDGLLPDTFRALPPTVVPPRAAGSQKYAHMLFVNQPPRANRRFTDDELIAPGTMVDRRPPGHSCPAARCRPLERHAHRNSLHSPVPPAHSALAALPALYATTSTGATSHKRDTRGPPGRGTDAVGAMRSRCAGTHRAGGDTASQPLATLGPAQHGRARPRSMGRRDQRVHRRMTSEQGVVRRL